MTKSVSFEKSMTELEEIVMLLEKGELPLEDSLKQFEKGITLARQCQDVLKRAEKKIEILATADSESNDLLHD
ncbi:exodeoxyribonuclease VII small subunit [Legionella fairfieldensis]|uniref:exodeoxyribonuclease VII small subunit n=1 Tax=Legionella fairfieldensis TaxID=45064 RepID=UPI00048F4020|nr:exodeoxyribonuclease VII small subunit [Legionella fairfieldensis]